MRSHSPTLQLTHRAILLSLLLSLTFSSLAEDSPQRFNTDTDLLLAQFDSKTDVDDIHSIAAFSAYGK